METETNEKYVPQHVDGGNGHGQQLQYSPTSKIKLANENIERKRESPHLITSSSSSKLNLPCLEMSTQLADQSAMLKELKTSVSKILI